jgi:hypothetical protein
MLRSLIVLLAALAAFAASPVTPVRPTVPNFRDTTIRIRETRGLSHPMVHAYYFKGPRERTEISPDGAKLMAASTSIMQCDLRTIIHLNPASKTYTLFVDSEPRVPSKTVRVRPQFADGPIVSVTMDSVDTGERRQVAGYEARHLKSTITIDASKDASTLPGKIVLDTWYLGLPAETCHEPIPRSLAPIFMGMFKVGPTGRRDHFEIKYTGAETTGLILEERSTQREGGNVILNKTELLEVSEQPLDESLFEIPPDYTQHERPQPRSGVTAAPPDMQ